MTSKNNTPTFRILILVCNTIPSKKCVRAEMPLNSNDHVFDCVAVEDRGILKDNVPYSDMIAESHFLLSSSI